MENLLSEIVATYQHSFVPSKHRKTPLDNNFKDAQFVKLAAQTGLDIQLITGHHMKPGEGLFAALMDDLRIPAPPKVIVPEEDKKHNWWDKVHGKRKGSSTLILYTATNCEQTSICKLRGGKDNFEIACLKCGSEFIPQVSITQNSLQ